MQRMASPFQNTPQCSILDLKDRESGAELANKVVMDFLCQDYQKIDMTWSPCKKNYNATLVSNFLQLHTTCELKRFT